MIGVDMIPRRLMIQVYSYHCDKSYSYVLLFTDTQFAHQHSKKAYRETQRN